FCRYRAILITSTVEGNHLARTLNSGRVTGSGPGALKRVVRKKLAQKGWPGGSSRPQGAALYKEGRVRIEQKAGDGSMMASRSEEITDLIYVFSKSQYRAKEVTSS
ncbi:hypothetical protein M9458_013500, partial [Cirrhinus mrigala]